MKAVVLSCTLKPSPAESNTEMLGSVVVEALREKEVEVDTIRIVDLHVPPGVETDMGEGDQWPTVHDKILAAEILIVATPTWVGHPSSIAQRVVERMDAMISETTPGGAPVALNKVAGVIVTGNEDGAHHVISEVSGALCDIGFTIPGQAWTYWNQGPGPGPDYPKTGHGHEWSHDTGRTMAHYLHSVATALQSSPVRPFTK
ncbi:flavodoxin family protein [Oerskovia sp. NPDC060338]|jgi:multimeric flavodoxin WrbA|uniref:flavodoxin family protein n=1 Tax=Oerskovia sp. NPDC060338 TaxID=3347100 RepID=UPI0036494658